MLTINPREARQIASLADGSECDIVVIRLNPEVLIVTRTDGSRSWRILADGTIRKMASKKGLAA